MVLYLVSWFAFSFSFPMSLNVGLRHDVSSSPAGVEKIVNSDGVYLAKISVIRNGRLKSVKLAQRVEE